MHGAKVPGTCRRQKKEATCRSTTTVKQVPWSGTSRLRAVATAQNVRRCVLAYPIPLFWKRQSRLRRTKDPPSPSCFRYTLGIERRGGGGGGESRLRPRKRRRRARASVSHRRDLGKGGRKEGRRAILSTFEFRFYKEDIILNGSTVYSLCESSVDEPATKTV